MLIKAWVNIWIHHCLCEEVSINYRSSINIHGMWYIVMDLFQIDGFWGGAGKNNLHFHEETPASAATATIGFQRHSHNSLHDRTLLKWQGDKWLYNRTTPLPFPSFPPSQQPSRHVPAMSCLPHWDPPAPLISAARLIIGDLWSLQSFNKPGCYGNQRQTSMSIVLIPKK